MLNILQSAYVMYWIFQVKSYIQHFEKSVISLKLKHRKLSVVERFL